MFQSLVRLGKVGAMSTAFAAVLFASAAQASPANLPLTILGVESYCSGWTVGINASGPTLTCVPVAPPPPPPAGAPTGCTITPSPASLPVGGGVVTLTASCATGQPTLYDWTGGTITVSNSPNAVQSTNITATTQFSVTPKNSSGSGNTAIVQVTTVAVPQPTAGGFCNQYSNVLPVIDVTWGGGRDWKSQDLGGFPGNAIWVFRFTVPLGAPNSTVEGRFSVSEFNSAPTTRQITLSTQACDFRAKDYTGATGPLATQQGTSASAPFAVRTPTPFGGVAGLTAGQTYYVNVRNWSTDLNVGQGGVSCFTTNCNALNTYIPAQP